jgi:2-keto-4-pentenoate hydratase/2-oxohepta-3-ene-1,7-dioic acid hydratase in catechol pathway
MMIFDIYDLVSFISRVMTLLPGDVIATGTPEGVSPLKPGDTVSIAIQGVGELFNPVIAG